MEKYSEECINEENKRERTDGKLVIHECIFSREEVKAAM